MILVYKINGGGRNMCIVRRLYKSLIVFYDPDIEDGYC
jgi:hypothetical protein